MSDKIKYIFLNILLYGTPILAYSVLPFFAGLFGQFRSFLFGFLFFHQISFSATGIIFDFLFLHILYLLFFKMEAGLEETRVWKIYSGLRKLSRHVFSNRLKEPLQILREEKVSALFYFVKLVFAPVMMNFLIQNTKSLINFLSKPNSFQLTQENIYNNYFFLFFYIILVIDTLIFAFGYLVESRSLKNIVKSVEPTFLGWAVALMCYPPFNSLTANMLGWYSADFKDFGNIKLNLITGFLSVLLFSIYVWATIALGFKASNLTNRGIVSNGPYKYVRHPAYVSKNLSWWIMAIPAIKVSGFLAILSLCAWTFVYFMRALTEERHLSKDPEYVEYSKKVKYMFVPKII